MRIEQILCPTDFSAYSRTAINLALSLARPFNSRVHLVHALPVSFEDGSAGHPTVQTQIEAEKKHALQLLEDIPVDDADCVRAVLDGMPAEEIIEYARRNSIDLIVMATHGRTGLTRFLMGSFAEEVLRQAPCPVLTVKTTRPQPAAPAVQSAS